MSTTRRTFLKIAAAAAPAAALGVYGRFALENTAAPIRPSRSAPDASVLVSGGTLVTNGQFSAAARAANRVHYNPGSHILLILYASLPADRDREEKILQQIFAADGFTAESSHHYAGREAREKIAGAAAFFVGGGETFLLLRTLIETGQIDVLRERVLAGVPYHGTSAGANVAGTLIGCTNDFPVVDVPTRVSLGVFPTLINPHHPPVGDPNHAGRVNKIKNYLRLNPEDVVLGLGSGAIARRQGDRISLVHGPGFLYTASRFQVLAEGPVDGIAVRNADGA